MMSNQLSQRVLSWYHLQISILGLLLILGLANRSAALEKVSNTEYRPQINSRAIALKQTQKITRIIPDGIYLYGQSQQPAQIGKEYLIFKVHTSKILGAIYMPNSEFSCFYGTVNFKQLNLTVVDPYEKSSNFYAIALERLPIATNRNPLPSRQSIELQGYHQINKISDNDLRVLGVCKNEYPQYF